VHLRRKQTRLSIWLTLRSDGGLPRPHVGHASATRSAGNRAGSFSPDGHRSRIPCLLERPYPNARMNGLSAAQQFRPDHFVSRFARVQQRFCYRDGLFCVVGSLGDAPFISPPHVPWNDTSRLTMEPFDSFRVPPRDVRSRRRFRLLANRITGCQSVEAGRYLL
jgi:hypothetical protein